MVAASTHSAAMRRSSARDQRRRQPFVGAGARRLDQPLANVGVEHVELEGEHVARLERRRRARAGEHPLRPRRVQRAVEVGGAAVLDDAPEEAVVLGLAHAGLEATRV